MKAIPFKFSEHELYLIYVDPILDRRCDEETKKLIFTAIVKAKLDGFEEGIQRRHELDEIRARNFADKLK